jgi:hypothetical protein
VGLAEDLAVAGAHADDPVRRRRAFRAQADGDHAVDRPVGEHDVGEGRHGPVRRRPLVGEERAEVHVLGEDRDRPRELVLAGRPLVRGRGDLDGLRVVEVAVGQRRPAGDRVVQDGAEPGLVVVRVLVLDVEAHQPQVSGGEDLAEHRVAEGGPGDPRLVAAACLLGDDLQAESLGRGLVASLRLCVRHRCATSPGGCLSTRVR